MTALRPLLGASIQDIDTAPYPCLASFKLDGIRAIKYGPELLSRTLKTIPNRSVRALLAHVPSGWDGELIVGEPNGPKVYRDTNSYVMALDRTGASVRFFVFDNHEAGGGFTARLETVYDIPPYVVKLPQHRCADAVEVLALERRSLELGYEGLILRHPAGRYKYGRSTLREGYLLKLKRFVDAEAKVIGFEELMHNANEATVDNRGYAKRSSHAEGKIPMGILGALVCEMGGVEFRIGTGFTQGDRREIWTDRDSYLGKLAKFKSLPIGVKDAPRHPVWLGWRSEIDL